MLMERKMMMKDIVPFVPWTNRSSRREPPIYLVDGREDDDEGHRAVRATRPSARWEGDIGVDAVGRRNPVSIGILCITASAAFSFFHGSLVMLVSQMHEGIEEEADEPRC